MSLSELQVGEKAEITHIDAQGAINSRLRALGLTTGAEIKIARQTVAKQTLEAQVGSNSIALRREEAQAINVRKLHG